MLGRGEAEMTEVVVNRCFGGFGLSHKAVMRYADLKGMKLFVELDDITKQVYKERAVIGNPELIHHYWTKENRTKEDDVNDYYFSGSDIKRDDPTLIQVIRELGKEANGLFAKLDIVTIPDDVDWEISEYDGSESVEEVHRSW
jgi:hypothetical protein